MWNDNAFFDKTDLFQYITPQQMRQMEEMNPLAAKIAYDTAIGYVTSEIGHIYNLPEMLNYKDRGEERDLTLYWILLTITARNIMGCTLQVSPSLEQQYEEAIMKVRVLKSGFSDLMNAPVADVPNATVVIVDGTRRFLG